MLNIVNRIPWRLLLIITLTFGLGMQSMAQEKAETLPGRIVIRTTPGVDPGILTSKSKSSGGRVISAEKVREINPALPWIKSSAAAKSAQHPLSDIYFIELNDPNDLKEVMEELNGRKDILYAEPYYLFEPLHTPNDPLTADQEHIDVIRARDAWALEKGDSTLVIGILDSGISLDHPDLVDNIAINHDDPVNGIDDDGDGLVDNRRGWDISDDDNNPSDDTDPHGTWVSGVSSASTNNNTGISGTGYYTKIMPLKIFKSNSNNFSKGYEAIALAADLGCDVINLSWGSEGSFSQFGQDVIDYAVLVKDVAIVAASGNTDGLRDFYPASFRHVLSVASTDFTDKKTSWSTYSRNIDLTAPGLSILTTDGGNSYIRKQGTSLSAPQVAGAVALVRARFPQLNALQAMERVRVNTDPIDDLPGNQPYSQFLGKGRLNMFAALANITSPAVRISNLNVNNGAGPTVFYGDSVRIKPELTNYLYRTNNLGVTLKSTSQYVTIVENTMNFGVINTLEAKSPQKEFIVVLAENTPADESIHLTLEYKDGTYSDFEHFTIHTSPDWVNVQSGDLAVSIAGNGNLGYAADLFFNGEGITFKNETILQNIALLISSDGIVADNLPGNLILPFRDYDFSNNIPIKLRQNSIADTYAVSTFRSDNAASQLNIEVEQEMMSWSDGDAVVLEYRVTNTGTTNLEDVAVGLFADFELTDASLNKTSWIDSLNISVTENNEGNLFSGIALIRGPGGYHHAIDKRNANGNISDLPGTITDEVKINLLYDPDPKQESGVQGGGNDVASMLISRLSVLNAKSGENIAIAISAATTLDQLISNIRQARDQYESFRNSPPILYTAEYCPGDVPLVNPPGDVFNFYKDPEATQLISTGTEISSPGLDTLNAIFATSVVNNIESDIFRIPIRKSLMNTNFTMDPDTVILDENNRTLVQFTDISNRATSWNWTFSNGFSSVKSSPAIHFTTEGIMNITLETTNAIGCKEQITRTLPVIVRTPRPQEAYVNGCSDLSLEIPALNNFIYRLYKDEGMTGLLGESDSFSFVNIDNDSVLFLTQTAPGGLESLPARIEFDKSDLTTQFQWSQDSTNLATISLLHFTSSSQSPNINWYVRPDGAPEEWIGFGPQVSYNYQGNSNFTIIHEVSNIDGCTGRAEQFFNPTSSPGPIPSSDVICAGSDYLLTPGNSFYHFYTTDNILLHKGNSFNISNILSDTVFLVRDASGLLESDAATATIEISQANAFFELPPAPFNMAFGTPLVLVPENTANTATWFINGVEESMENELRYTFTNPGSYLIELVVSNDLGCTDIYSQALEVVNITGLDDFQEIEGAVFPNPASRYLNISLPALRQINMLDLHGKVIRTWLNPDSRLSVEAIPAGVYIFMIQTDLGNFYKKVMITR
ncbi:S8 family serine peptidase [Fulvivirga sedimenti]|uniref:S8 family serine peptidase n=1 Tax=Fulvivirga sedimenti TaxID=2879465 RepID=A0A9X1KZ02_9BACT|nr:S8 family serine peptidase [Fulvivirga sedimenti]MCA6075372.1 S8 family serine peptidase [Fulvivirga sedimenti]MCA6076549.1 S8 family serine peptidase [Fulvivirga sedimenti]MCA6077677.1 S8 family serine peptidase [Fulvivirga sedimenti]